MTRPFKLHAFTAQFGIRLRQMREARNMTQFALAGRAGYSIQTIGNYERGETVPTLLTAFVLAEVLEVHPKTLLFGIEDIPCPRISRSP